MIRILMILMISIFIISCGTSSYYAYDRDNKYCTIEVDRKGYVIYRGIHTSAYRNNSLKENKNYIYIKSCDRIIEGYLNIDWFNAIFYLKEKDNFFSMCILDNQLDTNSYGPNKSITYDLVEDSALFSYSKGIEDDLCFIEANIGDDYWSKDYSHKRYFGDTISMKNYIKNREMLKGWLPPYLKKVDEIDYSKFSMFKVKKKFLKNPEKKGSPKSWEK